MFRRLLVASVCASVLAVVAPASAEPIPAGKSDRVAPVKKVVRQYGAGPVRLTKGQRLELRFKGERGDLVSLGVAYRAHSSDPYYGTLDQRDVSVSGRHSRPRPDATGYFRLPEDGWFSVRYRSDHDQHIQLFKQVRVIHDGGSATPLPQRRGHQYAVRLRAPRSGIEVVSFGTQLFGVVTGDRYAYNVRGQALVLSPGLPVRDRQVALSEKLEPGQRVLVMVDPSGSGKVATTQPLDVGRVSLDGAAVALPGGSTQPVVAELDAADLALSAQRLLNVRLLGTQAHYDWSVLVLPEGGGVAKPAAPAYYLNFPDGAPLYQLSDTSGTYRVLAFPSTAGVVASQLELDSVADGGTIAVDGAAVTVPVRADGRYTLLGITQPQEYMSAYLSVAGASVAAPWAVYAGRLTVPHCPLRGPLGCGEGDGVGVTSSGAGSQPLQYGGYVLTMPGDDQTTGAFTLQLTTVSP